LTDIGVFTQPYTAEDRSWLVSDPDAAYTIGGVLSLAAFTQAVHYPNGYIPSGTVVGPITAQSTGGALVFGPYDDTATDGRQVAGGILFGSVRALNPLGTALTKVGAAFVVYNAVISVAHLPFNSTNATTARGYIDDDGQTDLKFLYFAA
jgi:hypothetical protein